MEAEHRSTKLSYIAIGLAELLIVGLAFSILFLAICTAIGRIVVALAVAVVVSLPIIGMLEDSCLFHESETAWKQSYNKRHDGDK